jgi:hypothetical protein
MNGRVRSMNLWPDGALLRRDMYHIDVSDTSSIVREDYNIHGLHLNSQGNKSLMQPIAGRVVGGHTSGRSGIPVITHTRASLFF